MEQEIAYDGWKSVVEVKIIFGNKIRVVDILSFSFRNGVHNTTIQLSTKVLDDDRKACIIHEAAPANEF